MAGLVPGRRLLFDGVSAVGPDQVATRHRLLCARRRGSGHRGRQPPGCGKAGLAVARSPCPCGHRSLLLVLPVCGRRLARRSSVSAHHQHQRAATSLVTTVCCILATFSS